jgi:hypothetical protein
MSTVEAVSTHEQALTPCPFPKGRGETVQEKYRRVGHSDVRRA